MTMELGGNIVLVGFKELDRNDLVVVKKIVGTFVKGISEKGDFQKLTITMKKVHETEPGNCVFELNAKLEMAEMYNAEAENRNLYAGLADLFKKLEAQFS